MYDKVSSVCLEIITISLSLFVVSTGNMFDIKDFHDVVLNNGPMPLNILEILVNNWIDSKQENSKQIERTGCLTSTAVSYIQRNIIPFVAGVYLAVKFSLSG